MKKNSLVLLIAIAAMTVSLAGCGKAEEAAPEVVSETAEIAAEVVTSEITPVAEEAPEAVTEEAASEEAAPEAAEEADIEPAPDFMPSSFVEIQAMKETFGSFDELISFLEPGQGYAYCNIYGRDDEVLFICEEPYSYKEGKMAAIDGSIYVDEDGVIKNVGNVFSDGTAYPVSLDTEGYIFTGGNHRMEVGCASSEYGGYMIIKTAREEFDNENQDADGNPLSIYSGFVRETNSVAKDGAEVAVDDASVLQGLFDEFTNNTTPIYFTIVE